LKKKKKKKIITWSVARAPRRKAEKGRLEKNGYFQGRRRNRGVYSFPGYTKVWEISSKKIKKDEEKRREAKGENNSPGEWCKGRAGNSRNKKKRVCKQTKRRREEGRNQKGYSTVKPEKNPYRKPDAKKAPGHGGKINRWETPLAGGRGTSTTLLPLNLLYGGLKLLKNEREGCGRGNRGTHGCPEEKEKTKGPQSNLIGTTRTSHGRTWPTHRNRGVREQGPDSRAMGEKVQH